MQLAWRDLCAFAQLVTRNSSHLHLDQPAGAVSIQAGFLTPLWTIERKRHFWHLIHMVCLTDSLSDKMSFTPQMLLVFSKPLQASLNDDLKCWCLYYRLTEVINFAVSIIKKLFLSSTVPGPTSVAQTNLCDSL